MCAIVGLVDLTRTLSPDSLARLTTAMRDQMVHRGPDDAGIWADPDGQCALGHRRLSIIDLRPEGRQPMQGAGVDTIVTFNGEIYNYQSFRQRLEARGRVFRSRSDTEILPHLLEELDPGPLAALSGMFAFGLWHRQRRELLLARDAYGEKPLYIYEDKQFLAFASEVQAFYALPSFDATLDERGIADYLLLGYLPGPRTIYRSVRMLEAGSWERLSFASVPTVNSTGRFFKFEAGVQPAISAIDRDAVKARLRNLLIESVEERMISDVPLGAFLSGGVDSSLVVAIVRRELGRPISTFSIGFEGSDESEHEQAREIAAHLGTDHHDSMLRPEGLSMIYTIARALDQPNGDSSCLPTYLLSEFTRRHVTVALSGDGGDELFGGYGRYRDTMNELDDPVLRAQVHGRGAANASPADLYMSLRWHIWLPAQARAMLGGHLPEETEHRLAAWRAALNNPAMPVIHRMRTIDANVYMPGAVLAKVDRMSMQHSLEVRCPLLDVAFGDLAMGLSQSDCWAPPATTKRILKDIATDYLPRAWMHRSKRGFGLPANAWGMRDMLGLCRSALTHPNAAISTCLDKKVVSDIINTQSQPGNFSIYQMWPLLMLELWLNAQPAKRAAARQSAAKITGANPGHGEVQSDDSQPAF